MMGVTAASYREIAYAAIKLCFCNDAVYRLHRLNHYRVKQMRSPKQNFCLFDGSGNAIGIIAPSIFYALVDGKTVIEGPAGSFQISEQTSLALEQGLRLAGALIPGSPDEIKAVSDLLHDPATSRTTSFFLCKAKTCADLLNDMRMINSSRVLVIGCGGIGSSLALLLAGSGIKDLTLADADIIESSNLNRQLFWRKKDIGRAKTDILQREINDRFDDIKIQTIRAELNDDEIIDTSKSNHVSAIAITTDNPPTLVSKAREIAATLKIPVVSGGYLHSHCTAYFFQEKIIFIRLQKQPARRLGNGFLTPSCQVLAH